MPSSNRVKRLLPTLLIAVMAAVALAPVPIASAHDGDFKHLKSHFYTKATANQRFTPRMFAVVGADGTLVRHYKAAASTRSGPGTYWVTFKRDISTCAYAVTPIAENGATPIRFASIGRGGFIPDDQVVVAVFGSDGSFLDGGFSLVVTC